MDKSKPFHTTGIAPIIVATQIVANFAGYLISPECRQWQSKKLLKWPQLLDEVPFLQYMLNAVRGEDWTFL